MRYYGGYSLVTKGFWGGKFSSKGDVLESGNPGVLDIPHIRRRHWRLTSFQG